MNSRQFITRFVATVLCITLSHNAIADVLELTEKEDWISLVGKFTTIGFTEYPNNTFITDQYEDLGVIFTDGNDNISCCSEVTFPEDGAGLDGNQSISLVFDTPQTYIAADFPGGLQIDLYEGNTLLSSSIFIGSGHGFFFGVISTEQFDALVLSRPNNGPQLDIDDLHFGFSIPGDVNHDGIVGFEDLLFVLTNYGSCPDQIDPCPGDINNNNIVGLSDMFLLLDNWGPCEYCNDPDPCQFDIDGDCYAGTNELLLILSSFGPCPDKNYITCPADITFDGTVDAADIQLILDNWSQ